MERHIRSRYFVVGEGVYTYDDPLKAGCHRPSTREELREFRFSRMGPRGQILDEDLRRGIAAAMTTDGSQQSAERSLLPAGFTYLAQFVDHDLSFDRTRVALGTTVSVEELAQGRSPALDLDSLYGRGPTHPDDQRFYIDGVRLRSGRTQASPFPQNDPVTNRDLDGFDLPRSGAGALRSERRAALIPDARNDENLAVAQTHLAFIRFHNRVVDEVVGGGRSCAPDLFNDTRTTVVKHYQWMLRHDFLPRIVDPATVDDVFINGRRHFEIVTPADDPRPAYSYMHRLPDDMPTMPIEFSVAAYRLGHSMVRAAYEWNRVFRTPGPGPVASLALLFTFSGTSGTLSPDGTLDDPESGSFERLPTNWIADFRRLFNFGEAGRADLQLPDADFNAAMRIDSLLVDPLRTLPLGSFGARGTQPPPHERNLAFRNLTRAQMVELASGQQMAQMMNMTPLTAEQILNGNGGAVFDQLSQQQRDTLVANTPLWLYVLREAELNGGRLSGVGGRIVAEVFHRAMEGSRISILRDPGWRPSLGPDAGTFRMVDLLLFAFEGRADLLNPLGPGA